MINRTILIILFLFFQINSYANEKIFNETDKNSMRASCNTSIRGFLNEDTGILKIPMQISSRSIKSIAAIVDFRESHGGYKSKFGFKNLITGEKIKLFEEVAYSDGCTIKNRDTCNHGDNDWLGSIAGGVLGNQFPIKIINLDTNVEYQLIIWGEEKNDPPHEQSAESAKTNFTDKDNNDGIFTFTENWWSVGASPRTMKILNSKGSSVATIIGFEDGWPFAPADYNDVIVEMCLKVNF